MTTATAPSTISTRARGRIVGLFLVSLLAWTIGLSLFPSTTFAAGMGTATSSAPAPHASIQADDPVATLGARMENLAVVFDLRCHVSASGKAPQLGAFTVIKCVSADFVVRSHFLALLPGISAALGRTNDEDERRIASGLESRNGHHLWPSRCRKDRSRR